MEPRKIIIEPAMNGFMLRVGCTRVVLEGKESLVSWLTKYINDPRKTEKEFEANRIWPEEREGLVGIAPPTPYQEEDRV